MSELIDRSVLKARMYTEAFESDTNMQRSDSGCWIRYKLFEKVVDNMPTVPYSPRWHRVEEELPTEKGPYITAYYDGYVGENVWNFIGIGETAVGWLYDADDVHYWMPMPTPPKEDA